MAQIHLLLNRERVNNCKQIHREEICGLRSQRSKYGLWFILKYVCFQVDPSSMKQQSVSIMIQENDPIQVISEPFYFLTLMILFIPRHSATIYAIPISSLIYCAEIGNRLA